MKKIGIVGCGAIGSSLAKAIAKDFKAKARLSALYDIALERALSLAHAVGDKSLAVCGLDKLIAKSDLIIESASADCSYQVALKSLLRKKDVMVMSVGGLVNGFQRLEKLAEKNNCRIFIPSGAIAGVDALKAAKKGRIKSVTLTTRKNPLSLAGVGKINKPKIIFSGSARQAIKLYPKNINVSAVLSIAGMGVEKTRVRIIADPKVKTNMHEIEIISSAGKVFTRTDNLLHPDNPKTSFLAVLSAIAVLDNAFGCVKVGT